MQQVTAFITTVLVFRPIKGQKKTFEELLEEQLQLEEQRLKSAEQQVIVTSEKSFILDRLHSMILHCW